MKRLAIGGLALTGVGGLLAACAPLTGDAQASSQELASKAAPETGDGLESGGGTQSVPTAPPPEENGPGEEAEQSVVSSSRPEGRRPSGSATVEIDRVGDLVFDAGQVQTVRPDIFQPGHYSLFDILVHLSQEGRLELAYHFDESADTHVIDAINGDDGWWHQAFYSAGWPEPSVFRMDMYPYKSNAVVRYMRRKGSFLEDVLAAFRDEVKQLAANNGHVIIPEVTIDSPVGRWEFEDVEVIPHNVRADVLQPGVITALDALLSLEDQAKLAHVGLTWYDSIGPADPVDSFWVEEVENAQAVGGCGFVYETGPRQFSGFQGSHIHIPADVRVTVSPEYALWFWICLGRGAL